MNKHHGAYFCLSSGKLYRPSDKATLLFFWGVLLHSSSPHRCCHRILDPSKSNLHCTLRDMLYFKSETCSNPSMLKVQDTLETLSTYYPQRDNKGLYSTELEGVWTWRKKEVWTFTPIITTRVTTPAVHSQIETQTTCVLMCLEI